MNLLRVLLAATLLALLSVSNSARADYIDQDPNASCSVRVQFPTPTPANPEVFILAVGTAMTRHSYDLLSAQLIGKGFVVVNMDHNPKGIVKTDAAAYRDCAMTVKSELPTWLVATGFQSAAHWIMGGHSAGGQAAQDAISTDPALADAIFSIDPYNADNAGPVAGPALYWGFSITTCFVNIEKAAKAAYYQTSGHRAFYRVQGVYSMNPAPCGYSPQFFHCSFCDFHCPGCFNCTQTPSYFYVDIANSVLNFVNAEFYEVWSKAGLTTVTTTPTDLFVDSDTP
jgi:hypothetical protein